jgi:allophanate hydrolase
MSGLIEITAGGPGCSVQDGGRLGRRHEGLPVSGCLDRPLADAANALVGNPLGEACIELRGPGPGLVVREGPVRLALAGQASGKLLRASGVASTLAPWVSATLEVGDRLQLGAVVGGCAYLAVSGGLLVPPQLGSRSTYQRAGIGGLKGRALEAGDRLPCGSLAAGTGPRERRARAAFEHDAGPIRVMLGPQQDHFTPAAIAAFLASPWQVTPEQDRMGMRLSGTPLAHLTPAAADIVSDGVTPGAIQVPASGQPIVLLADCQTVGGYPKIATVISADLPRLAQARPGQALRFEAVDATAARQALQDLRARWQAWATGLESFLPPGFVDEDALYGVNLVSGMVCAARGQ